MNDLIVDRHATVGGDTNLRGNTAIGGDLKVEGWLEAPNIKGALKGLYASAEILMAQWPRPEPGWFALVGDTLPATLFRSEGGKWTNCGVAPESFSVDMQQFKQLLHIESQRAEQAEQNLYTAMQETEAALHAAMKNTEHTLQTTLTAAETALQSALEKSEQQLSAALNTVETTVGATVNEIFGRTPVTQSTGYPGTNINTARYVADMRMKWKDGDILEKIVLDIANISEANTVMSKVAVFDSENKLRTVTDLGILKTPGRHEFDVSAHHIEVNSGWHVTIRGLGYCNKPNDSYFYDFESHIYLPNYGYAFEITVSRRCLDESVMPPSVQQVVALAESMETGSNCLRVLCIGNSFTHNALGYVPFIIEKLAPKLKLTIAMACIDGAGLVQQCASITGEHQKLDGTSYTPKPYTYYKHTSGATAWSSASGCSAESVLTDEEWDIVTMQQNGSNAFKDYATYYAPYLMKAQLAALTYLKAGVRFGWLLTHGAYSDDLATLNSRWQGTANNAATVTECSMATEIFPYGTAIENLRIAIGTTPVSDTPGLMADTFHLQEGLGCLCAAYSMALSLMRLAGLNTSVLGDTTRPDAAWITARAIPGTHYGSSGTVSGITEANCLLAQTAAQLAHLHPYRLSSII
ncbi:MAG: DUF4886 domain-containing protein [Muribaculaceae bacterium]|nr:DUF4886 domain-containing protein [Muribaculaceae bacterium]